MHALKFPFNAQNVVGLDFFSDPIYGLRFGIILIMYGTHIRSVLEMRLYHHQCFWTVDCVCLLNMPKLSLCSTALQVLRRTRSENPLVWRTVVHQQHANSSTLDPAAGVA